MFDGVGEVFQSANGNGLFGGVTRRAVGFRYVRNDHLHIALGTQGTALKQRALQVNAALVHVCARLHIIKRVTHAIESFNPVVIKHILGIGPHFGRVRLHVEVRIHLLGAHAGGVGLELLNVLGTEQKLAIQIRLFNDIHISAVDSAALAGAHAHHGPILEHLTPNRARTHQKILEFFEFALESLAETRDLAVVPRTLALQLLRRQRLTVGVRRQAFQSIIHEKLADGHEFA
mmetsp:Transcript_7486/g.11907  ORF Transcript_7486/g.11907 Transcript_7486/m.11907 type:complete len:232 (-) Transcript_7486:745-1440(-)